MNELVLYLFAFLLFPWMFGQIAQTALGQYLGRLRWVIGGLTAGVFIGLGSWTALRHHNYLDFFSDIVFFGSVGVGFTWVGGRPTREPSPLERETRFRWRLLTRTVIEFLAALVCGVAVMPHVMPSEIKLRLFFATGAVMCVLLVYLPNRFHILRESGGSGGGIVDIYRYVIGRLPRHTPLPGEVETKG